MYQDIDFVVEDIENVVLEELWGEMYEGTPDTEPAIMYIKLQGKPWQRFFLEVGAGFWEECEKVEEQRDETRIVDHGTLFGVKGKVLIRAFCRDGTIYLQIKDTGYIILRLINPREDDTSSEIALTDEEGRVL